MLGFGSLPAYSFPKLGQDRKAPEVKRPEEVSPSARVSFRPGSSRANSQLTPRGRPAVPASRTTPSSRTVATPAAAPPAQQPLNPAQLPRGWSRNGWTLPPGQARKAQPPPPPPPPPAQGNGKGQVNGQRRGQTTTTTTTTTTQTPQGGLKKK
jgi:hypothetical protein